VNEKVCDGLETIDVHGIRHFLRTFESQISGYFYTDLKYGFDFALNFLIQTPPPTRFGSRRIKRNILKSNFVKSYRQMPGETGIPGIPITIIAAYAIEIN
jgi:hypothetical protein